MFRDDPEYAEKATRIAQLARDVSEFVADLGFELPLSDGTADLRVTYQSACSMQHGQSLHRQPHALLAAAGFKVSEPAESHLCCGSAGTYNILQSELADRLRERKAATIAATTPDVVATGNIGCMTQLAGALDAPIVHTVELLDWATGGPKPSAMA